MTTPNRQQDDATLEAYKQRISAQVQEAKTKLEQFEAKAREKGSQAEITAASNLKTAKQNIDQKLQDLKATQESHAARARAEIDADVAKLKASVEQLTAKAEKGQ